MLFEKMLFNPSLGKVIWIAIGFQVTLVERNLQLLNGKFEKELKLQWISKMNNLEYSRTNENNQYEVLDILYSSLFF